MPVFAVTDRSVDNGSATVARRLASARPPIWVVRILLVVGFLALIQLAVATEFLNPFFVPLPTEVIQGVLAGSTDGDYLSLVGVTLSEVFIAFLVAGVAGVGIGFLFWRFGQIGRAFEPVVAAVFSSPIVMLYPIVLVVMGRRPAAIVTLGVIFAVLPTILYTYAALNGVRVTLLNVGRSLGLGSWDMFRHILLPAAAPSIFTGLRIALTYVLIVVIAMEYILQVGGLGLSVAESSLLFRAVDLYVAVGLVVLISAGFMWLIERLEAVVTK